MKYWIITDTHFGHHKMIDEGIRPSNFEDRIISSLKKIQKDDILIHLGDFAFKNEEQWTNCFMQEVLGKKWLVKGNHDNRSDNWYLNRGWDFVAEFFRIKLYGFKILFSHWAKKDEGWFDLNIHGHFHNDQHRCQEPMWKERLTEKHRLVYIEHEYAPISLKSFLEEDCNKRNKEIQEVRRNNG